MLPGEALTGLGSGRSVSGISLGWNRARGLLASKLQHLFQLSYGSLLLLDLFTGEALTGLEAGRSVSGISCSQERRSPGWVGKMRFGDFLLPAPGWRLEYPSRGFLAPRRGAHRAGAGKNRLFFSAGCLVSFWVGLLGARAPRERRSPGGSREEPSVFSAGCLVSFWVGLLGARAPRERRSPGGSREEPSVFSAGCLVSFWVGLLGARAPILSAFGLVCWVPGPLERGAHRAGAGISFWVGLLGARAPRERRSPGGRWKDPSRTWAISYSKERRSPGWRWKDPSRTWAISYSKERRSSGWRWKDPSRTRTFFSFSGEAVAGLEGERSVSAMIRLGSRK